MPSIDLIWWVEGWNEPFGVPWVFFIGAELTIAQSRISLVKKKILKVSRYQGVQIHNRHIEIIVRQVTSKVLVSEDGMYHVFGTREFIGLLRAEGAGRAYDESIFYRNVGQELLLILQPKQEVFIKKGLEKAALHGPYWLVGLKENLVV